MDVDGQPIHADYLVSVAGSDQVSQVFFYSQIAQGGGEESVEVCEDSPARLSSEQISKFFLESEEAEQRTCYPNNQTHFSYTHQPFSASGRASSRTSRRTHRPRSQAVDRL